MARINTLKFRRFTTCVKSFPDNSNSCALCLTIYNGGSLRIAFIGLGEAAGAFITGWGADRASGIAAFDIKTTIPETAPEISQRAKAYGITHCIMLRDAVSDADVVFSTVTADQAITAARAAAPLMKQGPIFWT